MNIQRTAKMMEMLKLSRNPRELNPLALAFIGDGIYEVYVRHRLIALGEVRPHQLHRLATKYVSAKAQANVLKFLLPLLSEEEMDWVNRGRNAKSGTVPKNTDVLVYRHGTAFETLMGMLYLKEQFERLEQLIYLSFSVVETGVLPPATVENA